MNEGFFFLGLNLAAGPAASLLSGAGAFCKGDVNGFGLSGEGLFSSFTSENVVTIISSGLVIALTAEIVCGRSKDAMLEPRNGFQKMVDIHLECSKTFGGQWI